MNPQIEFKITKITTKCPSAHQSSGGEKVKPQNNTIIFYYLQGSFRTVLHENEHLLPVNFNAKVVDQIWMVDGFKYSQFICYVPKIVYSLTINNVRRPN